MAKDSSDIINYFVRLKARDEDDLISIRKWSNLKVAFAQDDIWISNFTNAQIESVEVKSLPYKDIYYSKLGKLYLINSLLPCGREPSNLWTPIERAIKLELNNMNFNYFGIQEKVDVELVEDEIVANAEAILCKVKRLEEYIYKAPKVRLNRIKWCLLNKDEALLIGSPLLPMQGIAYWKNGRSFLPVGYNFNFSLLSKHLAKILDSDNESYIIWNADASYFLLNIDMLRPLSISSFRNSLFKMNSSNE